MCCFSFCFEKWWLLVKKTKPQASWLGAEEGEVGEGPAVNSLGGGPLTAKWSLTGHFSLLW